MVLPDLMESEDNLNEYIKLRNIEGKVPIKKLCKDENFEIDKDECINANLIPIDYNIEKLEINNLDDSASTEQESLVESDNKCDRKTPEIEKGADDKKKGILKYQRTYSNKHVDFNMELEFVPFDESKDYTIDIQIVEQMPKKIVSYAALFAQQKKEEEEKLVKEAEEKEKQNRKHNKKRKCNEWKKNLKRDIQHNSPIQETKDNISQLTENHLSTEDEMDDEKDDFSENSCHSDTDKEEHSDTNMNAASESVMSVDDTFTNQSKETGFGSKTQTNELDIPLNDAMNGDEIKLVCNERMESRSQNSHDESCGNTMIFENNDEHNETCKNTMIFENNADNSSFCENIKTLENNAGITEIYENTIIFDNNETCENTMIFENNAVNNDTNENTMIFENNTNNQETCENMVFENNADNNTQLFPIPAKKQRSNSLSDLEGFRKPHRFVVQRLPREIELIICRELEKQYYE